MFELLFDAISPCYTPYFAFADFAAFTPYCCELAAAARRHTPRALTPFHTIRVISVSFLFAVTLFAYAIRR